MKIHTYLAPLFCLLHQVLMFNAVARGKHIDLTLEMSNPDVPGSVAVTPSDVVDIDRFKAAQALRNILSNALQYTPEGRSVAVKVCFIPDDADDEDGMTTAGGGLGRRLLTKVASTFSLGRQQQLLAARNSANRLLPVPLSRGASNAGESPGQSHGNDAIATPKAGGANKVVPSKKGSGRRQRASDDRKSAHSSAMVRVLALPCLALPGGVVQFSVRSPPAAVLSRLAALVLNLGSQPGVRTQRPKPQFRWRRRRRRCG